METEHNPKLTDGFVTIVEEESNNRDWFNAYQEVDSFIFSELEKVGEEFKIVSESNPELNTIESIKTLLSKEPILYTEEEVKQILYKWSMYKVNIELEKLADELPIVLTYEDWFNQNKKK